MSLRRAARVFACVAFASVALVLPAGAEDAAESEHVPELKTCVYQVADLIVPLATGADADGQPDFEWLLDLIELRTGADCWRANGGHGVITPHDKTMSLIVRQTQAVHERLADLLDEIRGTGDLALCVEIQLLQGNLDAFGDGKPNRTAQGLVDAAGKERLLNFLRSQSDGQIVAAPKVTFFNGATASLETTDGGCTKTFHVRGVISKDNRYSRLWLDAKVDGEMTNAEMIVPEGHTAVRKLPGHNSWLLVSSHVLNAEEPQVIAPEKAEEFLPVEQKKRYLVPVDESPEPTELTGVPQFKAQAEDFGLAVQRTRFAAEPGVEKAGVSTEAHPELAVAVDRVEYQVAQAEPGQQRDVSAEARPAVVDVNLDEVHLVPRPEYRIKLAPEKPVSTFEMYPLQGPQQLKPKGVNGGFVFSSDKKEDEEGPYRLWIGEVLEKTGFAQNDRCVTNTVNVESASAEPPARIDVCLDNADCQPAPKGQIQSGQVFDRIFVTPAPAFPMPWYELGGPNRTHPQFTLSHIEVGRRAILTTSKARFDGGAIVTDGEAPVVPRLNLRFIPGEAPTLVQQASGVEESVVTLDSHLKAAESTLDKLGLDAEERTIHLLRQKIRARAEERCKEIDHEINRLKLARERLEKLAKPEAGQPGR